MVLQEVRAEQALPLPPPPPRPGGVGVALPPAQPSIEISAVAKESTEDVAQDFLDSMFVTATTPGLLLRDPPPPGGHLQLHAYH